MPAELIRLAHVVSSALMLGVGVGAFWFMVAAARSGNVAVFAVTVRNAIRAEWYLAVPVALIQPLTGYLLMLQRGYSLQSAWFAAVAALYIVAGVCWVYLVKTELRLRDLVMPHEASGELPPGFNPLFRRWVRLAAGAFAGVLAIFWLMVFRPGL